MLETTGRDAKGLLPFLIGTTGRLLATAETIGDEAIRAPSLLPGWSRAHVLAHIAGSTDSRVRPPIRKKPPSSRTYSSPGIRPMSTRCSAVPSRNLSSGSRLCPPEITFADSPNRESSAIASGTEAGA